MEDNLRSTLHCDDKAKLRMKLAHLQREYHRTVQRLKRAERSEVVRKHVRTRVTELNLQDQSDPGGAPSPCPNPASPCPTPDTPAGTAPGLSQSQGPTGDHTESEHPRRNPAVRFLLPSESPCPLTPDSGLDPARGHRASPALRLRSRRSRLRWEKRWRGSGENSEEGREASARTEEGEGEEEREKMMKSEAVIEVVDESEELLAGSESGSPSLLLTHWKTAARSGERGMERKEGGGGGGEEKMEGGTEIRGEGENECESPSLLLAHWSPTVHTGRGGAESTQSCRVEERGGRGGAESTQSCRVEERGGRGVAESTQSCRVEERGGEERGGRGGEERGETLEHAQEGERREAVRENKNGEDTGQNGGERRAEENSSGRTVERGEKSEGDPEKLGAGGEEGESGGGEGILASCTLVDGLLFPAEYYVRTTRRMASSQSQPDLQAVILSQLTRGRQRRGRGRGWNRRTHPDRHTHASRGSDSQVQQPNASPLATSPASSPTYPPLESHTNTHTPHTPAHTHAQPASNSQSSGEQTSESLTNPIPAGGTNADAGGTNVDAGGTNVDAGLASKASTAGPVRGRRRNRWRGRGRGVRSGRSLGLDTDPLGPLGQTLSQLQPPGTLSPPSFPLSGADGPEQCLISKDPAPTPDHPQSPATLTPDLQRLSGVDRPQHCPASERLEQKVFPIFRKSSSETEKPPPLSRASWRSLLLPMSPSLQTPLPPLPPGPVGSCLVNFDLQLDFYLPDDQFASLKLHKLRQVITSEPFSSPSYNTRSGGRRIASLYSDTCDQASPLPLPLSPTPPIAYSPHDERQSAIKSADHQCLATASSTHQLTDKLKGPHSMKEPCIENSREERVDLKVGSQSGTNSTKPQKPLQSAASHYIEQSEEQAREHIYQNQSSAITNPTHQRPSDHHLEKQAHSNCPTQDADLQFTDKVKDPSVGHPVEYFIDHTLIKQASIISTEEESGQSVQSSAVHQSEGPRHTNHQSQEDKSAGKILPHPEYLLKDTSERPPKYSANKVPSVDRCKDFEGSGECPTRGFSMQCPAKRSSRSVTESPPEPTTKLASDRAVERPAKDPLSRGAHTQLLLSPSLASPPCPLLTPHLPSSALPSSPPLPSLGFTPHPLASSLPLSAPPLPSTTPPPPSPSTGALSPPPLSPSISAPLLPSTPPPPIPSTGALSPPPLSPSISAPLLPFTTLPPPSTSTGALSPPPLSPYLSAPLLPSTTLPPPSPSTQALSPPPLSPYLSAPLLPSTPPPPSPSTGALSPPPLSPYLSAPMLPSTTPPPPSPSTGALSPPPLSPYLSAPLLLATPPPPFSPCTTPSPCRARSSQLQASSHPLQSADQSRSDAPADRPHVPSIQAQSIAGVPPNSASLREPLPALPLDTVERREEVRDGPAERAEECVLKCQYTLKAPAGGCLVDACCVSGPSGGVCVAAAGKWAVCVWGQTSASHWSLIHTWTFNEPVISVFPVPDAAGLLCLTLGQLEIRGVRVLSCSSLLQVLLCEGEVQSVVGVARSRVVSSSHSAAGSTLQAFTLSQDGSVLISQPLVSPGVCVGALAAVEGLPDALIGSAEGGRLLIWNLQSGQLLQRLSLGEGLAHTACLRGYSHSGLLFVLLQHHLLSSLEEEEIEKKKGEEEKKKTALFSLVAFNPLTGRSAPATRLYWPEAWSGRLYEADVHGSSVVGLSQSGWGCVWELGGPKGGTRAVWAPEEGGWQLVRWGGRDTLLTGHHNGDLTLYRYTLP